VDTIAVIAGMRCMHPAVEEPQGGHQVHNLNGVHIDRIRVLHAIGHFVLEQFFIWSARACRNNHGKSSVHSLFVFLRHQCLTVDCLADIRHPCIHRFVFHACIRKYGNDDYIHHHHAYRWFRMDAAVERME
jgi:hypothetical protein